MDKSNDFEGAAKNGSTEDIGIRNQSDSSSVLTPQPNKTRSRRASKSNPNLSLNDDIIIEQ